MAKVVDPVCGMEIDQGLAEAKSTHDGQTYYFCSQECKRIFDENPKEFVKSAGAAPADD